MTERQRAPWLGAGFSWRPTNVILRAYGQHRIRWIDSAHLVMVGALSGGADAGSFGAYVCDSRDLTTTKYASLSPERYEFLSYENQIAYRSAVDRVGANKVRWKVGVFGAERDLLLPEWARGSERAPQELWPAMGPGSRLLVDDRKLMSLRFVLQPEHGHIDVATGPDNRSLRANSDRYVELVKADGSTRRLPIRAKEMLSAEHFDYSHYKGLYVLVPNQPSDLPDGTEWPHQRPRLVYLISPDGETTQIELPASTEPTNSVDFVTAGLVWTTRSYQRNRTEAGGYLLRANGTTQKLFQYPVEAVGASPNGQQFAYSVNAGESLKVPQVVGLITF